MWTRELAAWSADMPRPTAILVVSAHWEEAPLTIGATETVPLVYDFWGFPERYYQVQYAAPGAPELADQVRKLLHAPQHAVHDAPTRGLDHGAYVPLVEMFPDADVPTLQISMPTLDPVALFEVGSQARAAARPGRADPRQRLHDPQPEPDLDAASRRTPPRRSGRASSTTGPSRRSPHVTSTR